MLVAAVALSVKSRAGNWLLFSGGLAFAAFSAVVLHQGVA